MPKARRAAQFLTVALIAAFGITISITTNAQSSTALGPGQFASMTIRADGTPAISAYNPVTQDLVLYACADASCENGTAVTLDSEGNTGEYSSMLLGADGFPVIAYYNRTKREVWLIDCGNSTCTSRSNNKIYSSLTNDIGQFVRLALPADGRPIAAYYDATDAHLNISRCGTASCATANTRRKPDETASVGKHLSLALNGSGNPVITYYNETTGSLKLAVCSDLPCNALVGMNAATIDDGNVGQYTSIQIGTDGFPIIAYYDLTAGDLLVMDCNDQLCAAESATVLDQTGDVGRYTSMVLRDGLPVITYQDVTNGDLKLAECADTACASRTIQTIDHSGTFDAPTGFYTSLAIRPDGTTVIAYSDSTGMLHIANLGNREPAIALPAPYSNGSVAVETGQPVSFTLIGSDPDNLPEQTLTYSMSGQLPAGAALDPFTGAFTWTPDDVLQTYNLTFTVSDDGTPSKSASVDLSMTVVATRQPPTLIAPPVQRVAEETELVFLVSATDPDAGDTVVLGSGPLPAGASFDPVSGVFAWTPNAGQVGLHTVTFTATDGFTTPDSEDVLISVDEQVLLNAGFEQGSNLPDLWKLKLPTGDKYECASAAYEGICAFKFIGKPNKTTTLNQAVNRALVAKGDHLVFSTRVKAVKAITGKIGQLKITYKDGTIKKANLKLTVSTTEGWVVISAPTVRVNKKVRAVAVKMVYRGHKGRVIIDAVSAVVQRPIPALRERQGGGTLPVPPPPGFRTPGS